MLEPQYCVVSVVGDGTAAIAAAELYQPDIVLLDISMPMMNGLQAAAPIAQRCPSVRIIFVTSHTDKTYVEKAFKRGAAGYVSKGSGADLQNAIRTVLGGQYYRPDFRS